jgi:V8-like Glu-specific endopeptidase
MNKKSKYLAALLAVVLALFLASAVSAGGTNGADKGKSKSDTINFWTADKIAKAKPREFIKNPGNDKASLKKPDNPGGGGGGNGGNGGGGKPGGDGDSAVKGAEWTGTTANGSVQSTTGKLLFTLAGDPDSGYTCSGSVVDDGSTTDGKSTILTAGHCVFDAGTGGTGFVENLMFIPDFDSSTNGDWNDCSTVPYGCWAGTALVAPSAWSVGEDFEDDYGFVVVGDDGTSFNSLELTVGSQSIAFDLSHPASVFAFGYPHADPYDGTVLTFCSGTDISNPYGDSTVGLKCDMTGGSSGGPWFQGFDETSGTGTLTSVNSYKYIRGKYSSYMFGPTFDAYTEATYEAAKSVIPADGGNFEVPAP